MKKTRLFTVFMLLATFSLAPLSDISAQSAAQYKDKLEADYEQAQKELEKLTSESNKIKGQKASIEQAIALIDAQIREAQAKIRLKNIAIEQLTKDIGAKATTIGDLEDKLVRSKNSLADLIRTTQEHDEVSLPQIILANERLSDFFIEVDEYATLKDSINVSMEDVRTYKAETETQKADLEDRKSKELDARKEIEAEKRLIDKKKEDQKILLANEQNKLTVYNKWISDKQREIAQIRSKLFDLTGTEGIPFGDAYDYAVTASKATGVRPALILAILTQESDLGKNVGSCLVTDISTGDGVGKNTGNAFQKVMASPRDTTPFSKIADRLGKDWRTTPVSCPPGAKWYSGRGYGGGMGPSQFIPSTWELFKKRIAKPFGLEADYVDPWNPEHAIMATAIYLSDLGAGKATYSTERNAACRYYSGAACTPGRRPANVFYGDQVMAKAASIQEDMINPILGI